MERRFSLRGHRAPISCISTYDAIVASGDRDGWIVLWDVTSRRPRALWKAHDGNINTLKKTPEGLLSHGRDNCVRIWSVEQHDLEQCSRDPSQLSDPTGRLHSPPNLEIPVNSLNFCDVDYCNGLLATPASQDSNNFDIYKISTQFSLQRIVTNYSYGTSAVSSTASRGDDGIIMRLLFANENLLLVGYESGAVRGFSLKTESAERTSANEKLIINKDTRLKCVLDSEGHKPLPVLSMVISDGILYTGSASKKLLVYNLQNLIDQSGGVARHRPPSAKAAMVSSEASFPKSKGGLSALLANATPNVPKLEELTEEEEPTASTPEESINLRHYGIQSLAVTHNTLVAGFWDGVIKGYNKQFEEQLRLERPEEAITAEEDEKEVAKPSKKSLCLGVWQPQPLSEELGRKALIRRKKTPTDCLLLIGYGDGLISGMSIS